MVAYFIAKAVFGDVYSGTAKVKTIDKINASIVELDKNVFNNKAINPTVYVHVVGTEAKTTDDKAASETK